MNKITTWRQGYFVDTRNWSNEDKQRANSQEKLNVRPHPTGNAICRCDTPEDAKWIANRLNKLAILERRGFGND